MTVLITFYLLSIVMFGFVNNVIGYCVLLVLNALFCLSIIFLLSGFSWYSLLLYLVYVGGVYILFIFVSVHLPNSMNKSSLGGVSLWCLVFLLWEVVNGLLQENVLMVDYSHNFCSLFEGVSYLFLSLFLLVSFFIVSYISSSKESFIR
uniref:NADH dehydrogenase subunit 6 n=1 Tax=Enterogyrus malmbergi TaxID=2593014 RepID=A0A6M3R9Y1_9PLAT|nr:NADH dehydrogenase subunit 6 [Enterogyrus malmbergi]QJD07087.1 NADH dehydrogenase subunit 6 [Enterogyrus malmbergi]